MTLAWAQRQEALLRDGIVSPDVFDHMVERLRDFVVPYQHALQTEAGGKLGEGWDANTGLRYPCPNFQPKNIWTKVRTHFGLGSPDSP